MCKSEYYMPLLRMKLNVCEINQLFGRKRRRRSHWPTWNFSLQAVTFTSVPQITSFCPRDCSLATKSSAGCRETKEASGNMGSRAKKKQLGEKA